eukprot:TRINITY_DN4119_c0_g1_i1.p1 TRINITY_DN4119_c0_g1~~TRINITY_DN4119_c0_g1_i1.p1  ORF type:complete len:346 (-),score=100.58 TRINITY_DN4119_c0_g1_i1:101-1138(-)
MGLWFTLAEVFAFGSLLFYGSVFGLAKGLGSQQAKNLLEYIHRFLHGVHHMIRSSESSGKAQADADLCRDQPNKPVKTIIFFRHGESVWNEVFNRGFGPDFIGRLVNALVMEASRALSCDSVLFDTPLSQLGLEQAAKLVEFLDKFELTGKDPRIDRAVSILRGESQEDVVITVSNLRRAIQTAAVGLSLRTRKGKTDKYLIMSALQEMSRNVDTQSWLPPRQPPNYDLGVDHIVKVDPKIFDGRFNNGNKKINSKGCDRQKDFARWAFSQQQDVILVIGHSLWFKNFFKNFLPQFSLHESKKNKMVNCGVVVFDLQKGTQKGQDLFRIDQSSIKVVYGGFAKKG